MMQDDAGPTSNNVNNVNMLLVSFGYLWFISGAQNFLIPCIAGGHPPFESSYPMQ